MTTITATAPATDRSGGAALRPLGRLFLVAAALWLVSVVVEMTLDTTGTPADGWSFWVQQLFAYAGMIAFVWGLFGGVRRGLAVRSRLGRTGLVIAGIAFILILIGGVFNAVGSDIGGLFGFAGGTLENIGELLAGIGIVLSSPIARPARWNFLIYAIATAGGDVLMQLISSDGPGHLAELGQGGLWALIGLSVLRDRPAVQNRLWFALAIAVGIFTIVTTGA